MRGIIFSAVSVHGLIAGVKTQTRRPRGKRAAPLYKVGETLYVKEVLECTKLVSRPTDSEDVATVVYAADRSACPADRWPRRGLALSPVFMPYGCRRFEITVTEVREQRLQQITEVDAWAEGVALYHLLNLDAKANRAVRAVERDAAIGRALYLAAWDAMHGGYVRTARSRNPKPASVAMNPRVDAYTFTARRV
jgi:hypothetical protein